MELKQSEEKIVLFKGLNFSGQININKNALNLDITEFKRGKLYFLQITNNFMQKNSKDYLIFTKINELCNELMENKLMEVNDVGCLIVPISVTFKQKLFDLKITIPLKTMMYKSAEEEKNRLYNEIAKIYNQKIKLQNIVENLSHKNKIDFLGDPTSLHYKSFETSKLGKQIKKIGGTQYKIFNHFCTLAEQGIHYFSLKIIKTACKNIFIGVCSKAIKEVSNFYSSPEFIGLLIYNGQVYQNNNSRLAAGTIVFFQGKSIFKLEIDMNKKQLKWFLDNRLLCAQVINQNLLNKEIYPLVSLVNNGDIVEFID